MKWHFHADCGTFVFLQNVVMLVMTTVLVGAASRAETGKR